MRLLHLYREFGKKHTGYFLHVPTIISKIISHFHYPHFFFSTQFNLKKRKDEEDAKEKEKKRKTPSGDVCKLFYRLKRVVMNQRTRRDG